VGRKAMAMEFIQQIGGRLREERKESGLSLKKLAARSGVSAGTIHKIETGKLVPSIAIFVKIVKSLNRKASFFLDEIDDLGEINYIPNEKRKISHFSKFSMGSIPPEIINGKMGGNIFRIKPGGVSGRTALQHTGEEIIYVVKGLLEVRIRDQIFVLRKGDSLQFHCHFPHRWKNMAKRETVAIQICTPPVPV
jgi:transcriptional regulator with XRE-family HTH domain